MNIEGELLQAHTTRYQDDVMLKRRLILRLENK
jgi:hypothetical protein